MKIAILCAVILAAATAAAETTIIEYQDHYYVESADSLAVKPETAPEISVPPAEETSVANQGRSAPPATASPETNFDDVPQPISPAERRDAMEKVIQRLQQERSELMTPQAGETSDQAARRQQSAAGKLRKINRLSSELLNISVQGNEQSNYDRRP